MFGCGGFLFLCAGLCSKFLLRRRIVEEFEAIPSYYQNLYYLIALCRRNCYYLKRTLLPVASSVEESEETC
jgi:hypothetical protein